MDKGIGQEGKTKAVVPERGYPWQSLMTAKDIVSWKNKHQQRMYGKAVWATMTATSMFKVLWLSDVPNAFIEKVSPDTMRVLTCDMVKVEAVIRFETREESSSRKRNPQLPLGPLETPIVEFFLKTKGTTFEGIDVPDDDPFIGRYDDTGAWVFRADAPMEGEGVFIPAHLLLDEERYPGYTLTKLFAEMRTQLVKGGLAMRKAWARLGWTLGDFKAEFGWNNAKKLVIADVSDNDSWRLKDPDGIERSKQTIRDGKSVEDAAADFALVAEASIEVARLMPVPS